MEKVLIVSHSEKNDAFFTDLVNAASSSRIDIVRSCGDARRLLVIRDFDLIIINSPLQDETGEHLARTVAADGITQVILVVRSEHFDEIASVCENAGVLTIAKPINRNLFWAALKLAAAAQNRIKRLQAENNQLIQKIEDIRLVDRAKCVLIAYLKMSEQEAHRYIEKQAMDMRTSKRKIAERILKIYED